MARLCMSGNGTTLMLGLSRTNFVLIMLLFQKSSAQCQQCEKTLRHFPGWGTQSVLIVCTSHFSHMKEVSLMLSLFLFSSFLL